MDDLTIIELFWQRSEDAIAKLGEKYGALARKVAMNILSLSEDADECMNDSYLGMWNTLPPKRPDALMAYFVALTRNLALKKYRYINAEKRGGKIIMTELEDILNTEAEPATEEDLNEAGRLISVFLRTLDAKTRQIFLRRYYAADNVGDIARMFATTENNVNVILSRTRSKLRQYLESEGVHI